MTHCPPAHDSPGEQSHAVAHAAPAQAPRTPAAVSQAAPGGQAAPSQQNTPVGPKAQLPLTQPCPAGQSQALAHEALGQLKRRPADVSHACPAGQGPAPQQNTGEALRAQDPPTHASPGWQSQAVSHPPAAHTPARPSGPSQRCSGGQNAPEQQYTGSRCAAQAPPTQASPGGQSQAEEQACPPWSRASGSGPRSAGGRISGAGLEPMSAG